MHKTTNIISPSHRHNAGDIYNPLTKMSRIYSTDQTDTHTHTYIYRYSFFLTHSLTLSLSLSLSIYIYMYRFLSVYLSICLSYSHTHSHVKTRDSCNYSSCFPSFSYLWHKAKIMGYPMRIWPNQQGLEYADCVLCKGVWSPKKKQKQKKPEEP